MRNEKKVKNLLSNLNLIKTEIQKHPQLFLCLDYDGTLTPIKRHPDLAIISTETRQLIKNISSKSNNIVTIVTGRSYRDIFGKLKLDEIYYAVNHGFEIYGPQITKKFVEQDWMFRLKKICKELKNKLYQFRGVWIEYKGATASIHYRQAKKNDFNDIKRTLFETLNSFDKYFVVEGKMVYEIRYSPDWNKGKAVIFLIEHLLGKSWGKESLILYIGDDKTDEDAFKLIRDFGVGIKVAEEIMNDTHAKYFLKNVEEVKSFLCWINKQ